MRRPTEEKMQAAYDLLSLNFTGQSIGDAITLAISTVYWLRNYRVARFTGGPLLSLAALTKLKLKAPGKLSATDTADLLAYAERRARHIDRAHTSGLALEIVTSWVSDVGEAREAFMAAATARFGGQSQ
jgi:hypothetical protein